jgi:multiple antibiotic resistance protein
MEIMQFFSGFFINLLILLNPFIIVSSFIAIAGHASQAQQRALAIRSCIIATGMGCMFSLFGLKLLQGAGISTAALRIAGGFLLFRTAVDLVSSSGKEDAETPSSRDVMQFSVFPVAFPTIIGPGALCIIADASSQMVDPTMIHYIGSMVVLTSVIGINFAFMWVAPQLLAFMGNVMVDLVKRLVGLFLSMVSVQIMIMGCCEVYQVHFQPVSAQAISCVEGLQLTRKTCA